jgi:uncharacterized protein YgiM (DUF1202 family)
MLTLILASSVHADSVAAKNSKVSVYSEASTKSAELGTITKGEELKQISQKDKWAKVEYRGKTGYVLKKDVTLIKQDDAEPVKAGSQKTAYIQKDAKMYKKASTRAQSITIKKGSQVSVISQKGAWANVSYNGKTGYMQKKYLGGSKPEVKMSAAYAILDKVIIHADTSSKSRAVKTLSYGDSLNVKDEGGDWLKAKSGNAAGYVYRGHISASKPEPKPTPIPTLKPVPQPSPTPTPRPSPSPAIKPAVSSKPVSYNKNVKDADWWTSGIQAIFATETIVTITDVETGLSWRVKRIGGINHADVQPVSADDTAKFNRAYDGVWSWNRRAIWVTVGGNTYAASTNGMPHGVNPNAGNNFPGHHCIHFTNSRTHAGNKLDTLHQAAIQRALAAAK